jgi:hypothetical protein
MLTTPNLLPTIPLLFLFFTILLPFILSLIFFSKWLFQDIEVKWGIGFSSQLIFAITITIHFQLILSSIGFLNYILDNNQLQWETFIITCSVLLLRIIIPLLICWSMVKFCVQNYYCYTQNGNSRIEYIITWCLQGLYLFMIMFNNNNNNNIRTQYHQITSLGVIIITMISGWGSIYGPYTLGPWFQKKYNEEQILTSQQRLIQVMEMICHVKITLLRKNSIISLQDKLSSLVLLKQEIFLEVMEMKRAKNNGIFRRTTWGKFKTRLGYVFALFCIVKIILAGYSLGRNYYHYEIIKQVAPNEVDVLTKLIRFIVELIAPNQEIALTWAHMISTGFIGILVFNSVRGLFNLVGNLMNMMSDGDANFSIIVSLLLTELTGLYLVSSAVVLQLNLPKYNNTGGGEFEFLRFWMDFIFLMSCIGSIILIGIRDWGKRLRTEIYTNSTRNGDSEDGGKVEKMV